MNLTKENWFKIVAGTAILTVVGGAFYWYQWRPSQARITCAEKAKEFLKTVAAKEGDLPPLDGQRAYDLSYENCMHGRGF